MVGGHTRPSHERPAPYGVLLALLYTACGDSGAPISPPPSITPETLQIISGDNQRTATGRLLAEPLRVRVIGSDDQPLEGATVQWRVTQGNATLDPTQGITGAGGEAGTSVTTGSTVGTIVVSAAVEDLTPVTFSISALDPSGFTALSAGYGFTCALTAAGDAYCWGRNDWGALGDGTNVDRSTPQLVVGGLSFIAISAGDFHACGLTAAGAAYCWGDNRFSQLGDGAASRSSPGPVAGGLSFIALSAGGENTCGVTAPGGMYCWGGSDFDAIPGVAVMPERVVADVNFTAVSASSLFACGLTAAGAAHCWGLNAYGQLGDGTTNPRSTPGPIAGTLTFTSLTSGWGGWNHTCGLTAVGIAYCWGLNTAGQLGDGTTTDGLTPVPVVGGLSLVQVEAGSGHTCGVTREEAAYCWGSNGSGALGDGTTTDRSTPVTVAGGLNFIAVSAGLGHTCGITAGGEAYCWGVDGLSGVYLTPTRVER